MSRARVDEIDKFSGGRLCLDLLFVLGNLSVEDVPVASVPPATQARVSGDGEIVDKPTTLHQDQGGRV